MTIRGLAIWKELEKTTPENTENHSYKKNRVPKELNTGQSSWRKWHAHNVVKQKIWDRKKKLEKINNLRY